MTREVVPAHEIFAKAHAIGQYYGFTPLSVFAAKVRGTPRPEAQKEGPSQEEAALDPVAEAMISFLRQFQKGGGNPSARQPFFLWHTNLAPGRPGQKRVTIQFHALGNDHALADTVVIRALLALAQDLFREKPIVRVNSMGDKETRARWARELGTFFRKRANTLPEDLGESVRRDVLEAAELAIARGIADDLPSPIDHLSDASRKRFEDLLEYLEVTDTPYELARHLVSRGSGWSDTCFEVSVGGRRIGWGSRYGNLTKHVFPATPFSATGALLTLASGGETVPPFRSEKPSRQRIRFSFVHIGDEAKRLSIRLAEDFRRARIPLTQHIGVESLAEQMHLVERQNSPYLLIMGRKEALDGSAILRNRATQEETVLPLASLTERLKAFA